MRCGSLSGDRIWELLSWRQQSRRYGKQAAAASGFTPSREQSGFYEKQGYEPYGPVEYEEYCPHIWMKKKLL